MRSTAPAPARAAALLAQHGRVAEGIRVLENGVEAHDRDSCFQLALWRLSGSLVRRDLAQSRRLFGKAAEYGHDRADAIFTGFLASGIGGTRDWPESLRRLKRRAMRDPDARRQHDIVSAMDLDAAGDPASAPRPVVLSESPKALLFTTLFTPAECAYMISAAEPLYQPSDVVDPATGQLVRNPIRTSDAAMFPLLDENPAIHALNRRIAAVSGTAAEQGEPLQVLRYRPGQEYRAHSDALPGALNQRIQTVLVYLNEAYEGGETYFFENELAVRGRTGDALLFANVDAAGRPDLAARHAGLPVRGGTKIICSRWIRAQPLDLSGPPGRML